MRIGVESEDEYFGDFDNVTDWSFENKKNYYLSKNLPIDKGSKDGKPRIVSLITTKGRYNLEVINRY